MKNKIITITMLFCLGYTGKAQDLIIAHDGRTIDCTIMDWGISYLKVKLPSVQALVEIDMQKIKYWYTDNQQKHREIIQADSTFAGLFLQGDLLKKETKKLKRPIKDYSDRVFDPVKIYQAGELWERSVNHRIAASATMLITSMVATGVLIFQIIPSFKAMASQDVSNGTIPATPSTQNFYPVIGVYGVGLGIATGFSISSITLRKKAARKLQMLD